MADAEGTGQGNTGAGDSQGTGQPGAGAAGTSTGQPAGSAQPGQQGQQGAQGQQGTQQPQGTPLDSYEFKVEGVELDTAALDAFKPIAKELGLTGEQAQKLVDLRASQVKQEAQAHIEQTAKWAEDVKNDPEVGGAKFEESLRVAKAAVDAAGQEFKDFLLATGLGSHPVVFKAMHKFGAQFASDKPVTGESRNPGGNADTANVFFPSMKK